MVRQGLNQRLGNGGPVLIREQERLCVVAVHGHGKSVNLERLDHAPAGGYGGQHMLLAVIDQHQTVGIGVRCLYGLDLDARMNPRLSQGFVRIGQARIGRVPAQQPPEQPHVRPLAGMGRGQGPIGVKFDEYVPKVAIHQIPGQTPDTQCCGAVGTGRTAHHRPNHVIEDTDYHVKCTPVQGISLAAM